MADQQTEQAPAGDVTTSQKLSIDIYQIAGDETLHENRRDGTGWTWGWADHKRDWMEGSPNKFAYRCLPLTIVNQTGWWVGNPVGFTALWNGNPAPGNVDIMFDTAGEFWRPWINDQFGMGILTWNTPFLFRTKPRGSRLLVCGPVNYFRRGMQPLTALIETDWMTMSFTMNYKIVTPRDPVRVEFGEPLMQLIPLAGNTCADLEQASVTYQRLSDEPEVQALYQQWHDSRQKFHEAKKTGAVKADGWQKDYFRGQDLRGQDAGPGHRTKVTPPKIDMRTSGRR